MVRVVGKEGALGTGVGGNCSSGMDGSETITNEAIGAIRCESTREQLAGPVVGDYSRDKNEGANRTVGRG